MKLDGERERKREGGRWIYSGESGKSDRGGGRGVYRQRAEDLRIIRWADNSRGPVADRIHNVACHHRDNRQRRTTLWGFRIRRT